MPLRLSALYFLRSLSLIIIYHYSFGFLLNVYNFTLGKKFLSSLFLPQLSVLCCSNSHICCSVPLVLISSIM